jgi:NO-binding membrane sensor protein with MHYT domain
MDMGDALMAKFGAWIIGLLPAAIGSAISLMFKKKEEPPASKLTILIVFIAGVSVAHFFGHATVDYFNIDHDSYPATCIVITWGLFGLAIINEVSNRLPDALRSIFEQIPEIFRAAWKRLLGEK